MLSFFKFCINGLLDLIYPPICHACSENYRIQDGLFCVACLIDLPESDMYRRYENYLTDKLRGVVQFETGAGLFLFEQGSPIQNLIHKIKYKDRPDIAIKLGKYFGDKLKTEPQYANIDWIVPVPLYVKKLRKRGFNQSEKFALGLGESMGIKVDTKTLIRIRDTPTQTNKSKRSRRENVMGAFALQNANKYRGKTVLLIDDVVTTGATIGACAELLSDSKVLMASIGVAIN